MQMDGKKFQAIYPLDTDQTQAFNTWKFDIEFMIIIWKLWYTYVDGHHNNFVYKFLELVLKDSTKDNWL
jgi:hypothetical protein